MGRVVQALESRKNHSIEGERGMEDRLGESLKKDAGTEQR